jgi:hypothetical protein
LKNLRGDCNNTKLNASTHDYNNLLSWSKCSLLLMILVILLHIIIKTQELKKESFRKKMKKNSSDIAGARQIFQKKTFVLFL